VFIHIKQKSPVPLIEKNIIIKQISTIFVIFSMFGCSSYKPQFQGVTFEKHTSLDKTGFTQQRLDSLTTYLKNNLETTGILILKDGKVLYEFGDIEKVSCIASCRKSVLSILFGKYVENG